MFPAKTVRLIVLVTSMAWFCGTIPFRFIIDPSSTEGLKVIRPSYTTGRRISVIATFCINFSYIMFIAIRLIYKVYMHDETLSFGLQMGYQFFAWTMVVVIQFNTIIKYKEMPRFLVRYFDYFRYLKDRYGLPDESGPKCLKFFKTWLIVGTLVNIQNTLVIIKRPQRPHYLTAVLDNPQKVPLVNRLPFMLVHFVVWSTSWSTVFTLVFHLYAYFCGLVWAARELDILVKEPKTLEILRSPNSFHTEVRSLSVLHRLWQQSHEDWFCPTHKFVAICIATLGSYGVIKLSGPPAYMMACMAMITLVYMWTLFSKFGQVYDMSKEMLRNWRTHPRSTKWMRKFVRSVAPFAVNIGRFYRVHRLTVFTALASVLDNTITILLL